MTDTHEPRESTGALHLAGMVRVRLTESGETQFRKQYRANRWAPADVVRGELDAMKVGDGCYEMPALTFMKLIGPMLVTYNMNGVAEETMADMRIEILMPDSARRPAVIVGGWDGDFLDDGVTLANAAGTHD